MKRCAGAVMLLAGAFAPAAAQQPSQRPAGSCQIVVDRMAFVPGHDLRRVTNSDGTETIWVGGGVEAHCDGEPTTIKSDSMFYVQSTGNLQFIGRVEFRDSISSLDADHVTYYLREERLVARGNVYTRNRKSGSDLRGPHLIYYRVVPPIRDTLQLYATGRPTITFYPQSDSAQPGRDRPLPFIIIGNNVLMRHTDQMWGSGNVTIDRPDLSARSDSAWLNLGDSAGLLIGAPVVTGHDTAVAGDSARYRLTGQRIRFELTGTQQVRRVLSSGDADASSSDWRLTADTLDMALDSGRIQRTQAWGEENRPVAVSGPSTIVADSLDIRMPGQKMERIWAWGSARASSRPDSTVRDTSDAAADWLVGDSLRADFAERPMPADSTRRRTEIAQVVSFGNARAYYHVANERDSTGQRGISYSRGNRIAIAMRESRVQTVDIVGQVDGVYLEPLPPRRDTVVADSLRPRGDTAVSRPAPRPDEEAHGSWLMAYGRAREPMPACHLPSAICHKPPALAGREP